MLDVTYGRTKNRMAAEQLVDSLDHLNLDGSLYIGYPVLATTDESITVDALLVTSQHGLVGFLFDEALPLGYHKGGPWEWREARQNQLFFALETYLGRHEALRSGRRRVIDVQTIMVLPDATGVPDGLEGIYCDHQGIPDVLATCKPIEETYLIPLQAALQRVSTIKAPKRRTKLNDPSSRGAKVRRIETEIANLDQWQKKAAIECPDSPQRIRGLAGSGKTIVLALKAAYLHTENPDWVIGLTFWSRSLYQQFEDLVRRFCFEQLNDEPNWNNLRLIHAWGGRNREGLYQQVAINCGVVPRDFNYGSARYGMEGAFEGVCSEFLAATAGSQLEPIFDAVLIDEAQDLPPPFFQMVYEVTRDPKRIILAYDDLQKLSEAVMPDLDDLFGRDLDGKPRVQLVNSNNAPQQDIVLPICYRNTPWALALAHGLGLGTSREEGLVQSFDEPTLWSDIGYQVVDGDLKKGAMVTLERGPQSYPGYFPELLEREDAVSSQIFEDPQQQAQWVAQEIRRNLDEDELEHDDILIILPHAYTARSQAEIVLDALAKVRVNGHLVGVTTSQDEIFVPNSIAIANIYRSKGNEAPMVYILNSQFCVGGRGLTTLRNILFTAITRSKAWVRICGWGTQMESLQREIETIRANDFKLTFRIPTDEDLIHMRQIHRDLTASEKARADAAEQAFRTFLEAVRRGDTSVETLPIDLRSQFAQVFRDFLGERQDDAGQAYL